MRTACSGQGRGAVELASGDTEPALGARRPERGRWSARRAARSATRTPRRSSSRLHAPAFSELGAAAGLARLDRVSAATADADAHGLAERELQVLRHLAAGVTNKEIAAELVLSVRTADRHASNIFVKLRASRIWVVSPMREPARARTVDPSDSCPGEEVEMAVAMMVDNPNGSQEIYERLRALIGLERPAGSSTSPARARTAAGA